MGGKVGNEAKAESLILYSYGKGVPAALIKEK